MTETETVRITVRYPPDAVGKSRAKLKDEKGVTHFGDYKLLEIRPNDIIEVIRAEAPKKMKDDGTYWPTSYNITKWKLLSSGTTNHPDQQQLPIPPRPNLRPRTDPVDQKQIFMGLMMKSWNAAYAQFLSITPGDMKKVDAVMVQQAMQAYSTSYDQFYGPMTQSNKPPVEDDMNDEIGF